MATAAISTAPTRQPKPLPAPNSDFYELYETLSAEELATVKRVRAFMEAKVAPLVTKYWTEDAFPFEVLPALKCQTSDSRLESVLRVARPRCAHASFVQADSA